VSPINVQTEFRESFEAYNTATVWSESLGDGDIVQTDGNALSASYLVISKNPLIANTETTITTQAAFTGPFEVSFGASLSQRVLGQEYALELISPDAPLPPIPDLALASVSQAISALTVTTAASHNLSVGQRIGVYGVTSDSRMNYPSLVVGQILSPTQVVLSNGPMGALPSITVGPYNNQGYIYARPSLGYARDGMSQIFENATATNSSNYVRSDSGDVLPSGTVAGNQSLTVSSSASIQLAVSNYSYAFAPTTEYKFLLQADRAQFFDVTVDSASQPVARLNRITVVPSVAKLYKLRFRCTNNAGLTVPTAKIVSAAKAGTTTATITTADAHNLTTGDYVYVTGIRDGTNFVPITTAVVVASTPTPTTFTLVYGGTAAAVTSYGGLVARAQGGNLPAGFAGAGSAAAMQSVTVTAENLTLVSNGTVAFVVGDYVNLYGVRETSAGADLAVDGVYKVASVVTTTAILIPIGGTVLPIAFASTTCGGAVIKRTDLRLSYTRVNQYLRERVEVLNKSDGFSAIPVIMNGGTLSGGAIGTQAFPNQIAIDIASAALTTTNNSAAITPANNSCSFEFNVIVTAVFGTNPTMDVVVQESDDTGTNWYDIYHFPRITAIGQYRSPLIPQTGNRIRYVRTIGGATPSFTNAVNRQQSNSPQPLQRQFFDRTLVVNTINSVTPTFFTEGCAELNIFVSMGAVTTTAPVLVYECSPDNAVWVQVGADITTTASTQNLLQISNVQPRFSRIRVKTAGSGATLSYVMVKGAT
jgi:hypothetical protein